MSEIETFIRSIPLPDCVMWVESDSPLLRPDKDGYAYCGYVAYLVERPRPEDHHSGWTPAFGSLRIGLKAVHPGKPFEPVDLAQRVRDLAGEVAEAIAIKRGEA
jgi:hypothetical protein